MKFATVKSRCDRAWSARTPWDTLYQDVFDYVIPYRRPTSKNVGSPQSRVEKIYDNTAVVSAFAGAGRLQNDLFPPGEPFFKFAVGPLAKRALKRKKIDIDAANRELEEVSDEIRAFFVSGEFDSACNEMCTDLFAGYGCLLPMRGDDERPVRFVCVPMDEVALEPGPFGDISGIHWKTKMSRSNIRDSWPRGAFPEQFREALKSNSGAFDEIDLYQCWLYDYKAKRWHFFVFIEACEKDGVPIVTDTHRAPPMATPRYHRVPGEVYGRGPAMMALPTTKTLNKAVEIMLKAAAIQMLGLWAYRPGGAFNPATARIAPGAFWPMSSTGGVLGADVQRLDAAGGRMEVAQLVTSELRLQLQAAMNDDKLPDKGATPVSATEIMARMKRVSQNYLGAFGRLVNETVPPLVKRVAEILDGFGLLSNRLIQIDTLIVTIEVQSPMAAMLKAQGLQQIVQFLELVAALKGQQAIELLIKLDELLREFARRMGVPAEFIMTVDEQRALEQKLAAAAAQLAAAQTAAAAGPPQPQPVPA
jgi:hypothetical protein